MLCRKPLIGTVAANITEHGTGALNIDASRIGSNGGTAKGSFPKGESRGIYGDGINGACEIVDLQSGRWPANVLLDETAAEMLDAQSGDRPAGNYPEGGKRTKSGDSAYGTFAGNDQRGRPMADSGGASRFFYTAKSSTAERNKGLEGMAQRGNRINAPRLTEEDKFSTRKANHHPTVKPLDLMQWLVRLVTPPDGLVLDPFMGSGSTGIAADREGFRFIGIEKEPEYAAIAKERIIGDAPLFTAVAD